MSKNNLEVAKECGATENELTHDGDYNVCMNQKMLDSYTSRICSNKDSEFAKEREQLRALIESQRVINCNATKQRLELIDKVIAQEKQLAKSSALIAMQVKALKLALRQNQCDMVLTGEECRKLESAISASTESVAAWEAEKLEPLRREVAMLRVVLDVARNGIVWYSENSDDADDSDTEMLCDIDAALTNTQATAEAYERGVKAKVLEELERRVRSSGLTIAGILDTMLAELRAQSAQSAQKNDE